MRAATALDQVQVGADLVGAIDVRPAVRTTGIEVEHLDADLAQTLRSGLGTGHGAGDPLAQVGRAGR
jgi:hypothetical protein